MTGAPEREWMRDVRRVVVKVGSRLLVDESNQLDEQEVAALVEQVVSACSTGIEIVLVSSGAIAAGLPDLGAANRPTDLPSLQAAAALGQARLIEIYRDLFAERGVCVGQVLLTHDDMRDRTRHLNARNTIHRLLEVGAVPIINENDAVAVDEIRFGDNDRLSALAATLAQADLLILLTGVEGLLDAPPEHGGCLIDHVEEITPAIRDAASGPGSNVSTGGMRTKLDAAEIMMRAGERMIIADGRAPNMLTRLFAGERLGTAFDAGASRVADRKRWIAFFHKAKGAIVIDAGAVSALREKGSSLLPVGVRAVEGAFAPGDVVSIQAADGEEIARGLSNYSDTDARRIAGKRTTDIAKELGSAEYEELVHRDNLALA